MVAEVLIENSPLKGEMPIGRGVQKYHKYYEIRTNKTTNTKITT